ERVLLRPLELAAERRDRLGDVVRERLVEREELFRIVVLALQVVVALEPPRHAGVLRADCGCVLLVVPESRLAELLLELGGARPQPVGVKGNHGPSRAGPRSRRAAPGLRVRVPRPCAGDGTRAGYVRPVSRR